MAQGDSSRRLRSAPEGQLDFFVPDQLKPHSLGPMCGWGALIPPGCLLIAFIVTFSEGSGHEACHDNSLFVLRHLWRTPLP